MEEEGTNVLHRVITVAATSVLSPSHSLPSSWNHSGWKEPLWKHCHEGTPWTNKNTPLTWEASNNMNVYTGTTWVREGGCLWLYLLSMVEGEMGRATPAASHLLILPRAGSLGLVAGILLSAEGNPSAPASLSLRRYLAGFDGRA